MSIEETIELRLTLTPEDSLYKPFKYIKESLGIKSNSEVIRFIIKQISMIPISKLMEQNLSSNKKIESVKKELKEV